ncbi:hypothetical protein [Cohnella yongneupensis]|uniref:DUF5643 domain-containing protein n=1 Tax=Cohnella yongneupensis TaxID=425006 RepID=A0ABW0QYE8_9BACL
MLSIVLFISLPWLYIFIGGLLEANPPRPEIKYGEFPFRLEYEINGQRKVIEDKVICEFDGFGWNEGQGKYRKWKQRFASGNDKITLLKVGDIKEIYFPVGNARYYMGDLKEEYEEYNNDIMSAILIEKIGNGTQSGVIRADQLLFEYHIKLISWDYTQPIENKFK